MAKKYFSMNEVPLGTKMIIKKTSEQVELVEIQNFPTIFIVINKRGIKKNYFTYQVDIENWPPENED